MFFGCCCRPSVNNYWVRKFADSYPCNVLAEADVERFRDTGNDVADYPYPRDVVAGADTITVVSTDHRQPFNWQPSVWLRHIYSTDLDLLRVDKWNTPYGMHHSNGVRLALGHVANKAVDVFDDSGNLVTSVSVGSSDFLTAVCLDSNNNIYAASYQSTGTTEIVYVAKWNASGNFEWKISLGAFVARVSKMEYANDNAIWALGGSYQFSILRRISGAGTVSFVTGPYGATDFYGTYHPMLRANSSKMWRLDTSTSGSWFARRYTTTPSQEVAWTVVPGFSANSACSNADSAIWYSTSDMVRKYKGSAQLDYEWVYASPSGYAGGFNVCWENGFGPLGMTFDGTHIYAASLRTAKLTRRNPYI
jgi:hypothetical protein